MNIKPIFLLVCTGIVLIAACSKDDHNPAPIRFTGITPRDINADPIGEADPTDWLLKDKWTENEESLFAKPSTKRMAKLTGVLDGSDSIDIMAFPNPSAGSFYVDVAGAPKGSRLAYRIVDRNYKVLKSEDSATAWNFKINSADLVSQRDTVRIYYKITSDSSEYRGHGDIAIQ